MHENPSYYFTRTESGKITPGRRCAGSKPFRSAPRRRVHQPPEAVPMSADAVIEPLTVENTVQIASVGHRLAIGIQWIDALSRLSPDGPWTSDLEAIGLRPCPLRFDAHPQGRHALRAAGRLAKLLEIAAKDKVNAPPVSVEADQTNCLLRAFARRSSRVENYSTGNDPRRFVPRRLSLTPVQTAGFPSAGVANIRSAWLWPGSSYPLAANITAIRGRVRRGPSEALAKPVAWARVVITRPGAATPNFATEARLGFAHGDDRGEFLAVLDVGAVPGGAVLPATLKLRVWVFIPPADTFDAADPLASLPLEVAGTDAINDVLRGTQAPSAYLRMNSIDVTLTPGSTLTLDEAQLLFV